MNGYREINPCPLLAPLPVVLVSCGEGAQTNALAVAWAGVVCSHPPMVSVSIRPDRYSHDLIRERGSFVVNLVDRAHARALDYCGVKSGRDGDKLAACGLKVVPMEKLPGAWALDGLPVSLGCRVRQVIPLGSHDLFLGEVVEIAVREDLFSADGAMHLDKAGLVTYSHGVYQETGEAFGFFGWSVAREDTFRSRMEAIRRG